MRKQHQFRPSLSDILEVRLVLSTAHAHVTAPAVAAFQGQNLALISNEINAAFTTFALDYSQAQSAYLSAVAASPGATNSDLQGFITNRVGSLVQQIDGIVSGLPGVNPTMVGHITAPLSGTKLGTLVQELQSITPVGTNGQTVAQYASQAASIIQNATRTTASSFQTLGNLVNYDLYSQYLSQNTPASHKRLTAGQKYHQKLQAQATAEINQAFTTFFNSLNNARMKSLLVNPTGIGSGTSANASTTLDLSGNVSQYNQQLGNATIALSNSLTSAFAMQKGGLGSLQSSVVQSLFAPSNGLFSQLATMQVPTDLSGLSTQGFNNNLFNSINTTYQDVLGRFSAFNQSPNANFSSFNQFGNNSFVPSVGANGFFTGQGSTGSGFGIGGGPSNGMNNSFGGGSGFSSGFGLTGFNSFFGGTNFAGNGVGSGGTINNTGFGIGLGSNGSTFGGGTGGTINNTGFGIGLGSNGSTFGSGSLTIGNGLTTFGSGGSGGSTGLNNFGDGGTSLGTVPLGSRAFGNGFRFGFGTGSSNGTGLGYGFGSGRSGGGTYGGGTGNGSSNGTGLTG